MLIYVNYFKMKKSTLAHLSLIHGSLYDKATSGYHEKTQDVLLNDDSSNILSANLDGLLEQLENRCEKIGARTLDTKVPSNKKEQLKRQLRGYVNVPWYLYDEADLWAALKNYLRHLPSCALGSSNYTDWSRVQWNYWDQEKIERIKNLLQRLSSSEFKLVKHVFRIMHKIVDSSEKTDLGALELAARLGPYLLWERGQAPRRSNNEKVNVQTVWLVSYMIENYGAIFK